MIRVFIFALSVCLPLLSFAASAKTVKICCANERYAQSFDFTYQPQAKTVAVRNAAQKLCQTKMQGWINNPDAPIGACPKK